MGHMVQLTEAAAKRLMAERRRLARDVLTMAALGSMPDSYWLTDSIIGRACKVLGWSRERAIRLSIDSTAC